jgi:isoleucyl-tRNA synthetase
LINSPVVCAEFLRFKEEGVKAILRDVFLPWVNAAKFFSEQANLYEKEEGVAFKVEADEKTTSFAPINVMDRWILASIQSVIQFVRQEMDAYRLYTVLPKLLGFIENLTNWYVRLNRRRLKGQAGFDEREDSLKALFNVLFTLARAMTPFVPFLSENMYLRLKDHLASPLGVEDDRSVHFLLYPQANEAYLDSAIERSVARLQSVIELVRTLREAKNISLKVPLKDLVVLVSSTEIMEDLLPLTHYMKEELNVRSVEVTMDEAKFGVEYKATPNFAVLGKKLKSDFGKVQAALKSNSQ